MTNYTAQAIVYGRAFVNTILAALKTIPGGALVTGAKLRLSNNPSFSPTPGNVPGDFSANECAYSGYTAGGLAVTLSAPLNLSTTADGVLFAGLFVATAASPFVPDTATGWWIDDGTNVICAERFANNQTATFASPGAFLSLTALLPQQMLQATS